MDSIGALLIKAAEEIDLHGWCQGGYLRGEKLCVTGAIRKASGLDPNSNDLLPAGAFNACMRLYECVSDEKPRGGDIPRWNDKSRRTKEEVIDALVAAAYWKEEQK